MFLDLIGVSKLVGYTKNIGIFYQVLKLQKNPESANLDAQYADLEGRPNFPDSEEITMMAPFVLFKYDISIKISFHKFVKNSNLFVVKFIKIKMGVNTCIQNDSVNSIVFFYAKINKLSIQQNYSLACLKLAQVAFKYMNLRVSYFLTKLLSLLKSFFIPASDNHSQTFQTIIESKLFSQSTTSSCYYNNQSFFHQTQITSKQGSGLIFISHCEKDIFSSVRLLFIMSYELTCITIKRSTYLSLQVILIVLFNRQNILNNNLMEGQKRIQKYQFGLKNLLGQGSYANVYKGKVIETGEKVAVKVIDKRLFANSYNLKNIQSQIQIMKKVDHPNIVKLYDVYQTSNNMYIITQICQDGDFYHYLQRNKKIDQEQAKKYLKQIMKGIKYLHLNGIIHRDLKPANILMKNGQCKISDFGFAKNLESDSSIMKSIVGTPLYMSPQLLKKTKYTNKSDLWSIGLIFYEMLHGRTPWPATNQIQLINGIYSKKPMFHPNVSAKSKDFILKCLEIQQEKRMSWEQAFDHELLSLTISKNQRELSRNYSPISTSALSFSKDNLRATNQNLIKLKINKLSRDNKQNQVSNSFTGKQKCLTPTLSKNVSQRRLKRVQALTPKGVKESSSRLKQVFALTPRNDGPIKRKSCYRSQITLNLIK